MQVGENCSRLLDATIKNVEVKDVQLDEIWSFCGCKEKQRVLRGKSPVEYITTETDRNHVRRVARNLLTEPVDHLGAVRHAWMEELAA